MTAATKPGTAVTTPTTEKKLSPAAAEAQALRKMTVEIRGQQWGSGCSPEVQWAIARYCLRNNLDAVRHVEVLGGRIYLTAEFYREQGAELLLDGTVIPEEPQFVHHDDRLEVLAKGEADDPQAQWARVERDTRVRARIQYGVDEDSPGAAVVRFRLKSGAVIVGVNWIGGKESKKRDPVGNAEPTKTAVTRAERRAWRQVVEAIPTFRAKVQPIEIGAKLASAEVAEIVEVEAAQVPSRVPTPLLTPGEDGYGTPVATTANPKPVAEVIHERTAEDERFERELAAEQ